MNISNPFVKGTSAFQNFNGDVLAHKHLSLGELKAKIETLNFKVGDFLNSSDSQRNDAENTIRAIKELLKIKFKC